MQRFARPLIPLAALCGMLLCAGGPARAQSGAQQQPEHRPPRTAVHEEHKPHHTPVVHPHGKETRHRPPVRHKPPAQAPAAKPEAKSPAAKVVAPVPVAPKKPRPPPPDPNKGASTGLPLPRFAALRADDVNLRTGPGMRYPIEWVYKRRYLPVEIEREFDVWRLVAMPDGTRGWVNAATLIGRRNFEVKQHDATLRAQPQDTAAAVAILKTGVVGRIRTCAAGAAWCRVQVGGYSGFLRRDEIWGALPNEAIAP